MIQTEQETLIQQQKTQIEQLENKKQRKKVIIDSNTWFANIEEIKKAQDEAAASDTKKKARDWQNRGSKGLRGHTEGYFCIYVLWMAARIVNNNHVYIERSI